MLNDNFFHDFIASLFAKFKGFTGSRGWRRTIALILVLGNMVTSSGMTVLKEVNDSLEPDTTIEETEATAQDETEATEPLTDETTGEVTGETTAEATETSAEETTAEETSADETTATEETTTAVTETELTTKTFEGDGYTVTASYGPETGIPEDCELIASEIVEGNTYNEYMDLTAEALSDVEINRVRFFDICLMKDGVEYEPLEGTSVSVKIMLAESLEDEVNVVHISDDSEATVVDALDVTDPENGDGTEVIFEAEGFSAYAIVEGPSASANNNVVWHRIKSLDRIPAHATAIYIGNPDNNCAFIDEEYSAGGTRTGISKTAKTTSDHPNDNAKAYTFISTGNTNEYKLSIDKDGTTYYVRQNSNSLSLVTDASLATVFTFGDFPDGPSGVFNAKCGTTAYYINQQNGDKGKGFATYNAKGNATDAAKDPNAKLALWYTTAKDPNYDRYELDGKTYGLLYYGTGISGKGMMADSTIPNSLDALTMPVLTKNNDYDKKIFVPNDTDLTMWTFASVEDDKYYLSAEIDGTIKYLDINAYGVTVSDTPKEIQVIPGTGTNAGKISLVSGSTALAYTGDPGLGFNTINASVNNAYKWLNLAGLSTLTSDYVLPYSAQKISVSDPSLHTGSRVIIYTRVWDAANKQYRFYAVDHDGSLYECYEDGDEIQWIDDRINTLLWDLTIYYYEDKDETPENENYYYELYNEYSEKFIRPNAGSDTALGDTKIGINMTGRREGNYFSPFIAWDDTNYAYAGIRTDSSNPNHPKIISYPYTGTVPSNESTDFYFATIKETTYEDELHEVETVDNNQYGISMKIIDFNCPSGNNGWVKGEQTAFLGSRAGTLWSAGIPPTQGLLSTKLGDDGYPTATESGLSMKTLYDPSRLREVNHLFIQSTYDSSGYFVFDSTQNTATLTKGNGDNFTVYQELVTVDGSTKPSMQHGQFLPFDGIDAGDYSSLLNKYNALQVALPDSNPRKNELLHKIDDPDYQFGIELTTSFVQTPDGLDDWGHDIIYEFTGDDDFWLYVDDELVIDLGGVHSALFGSINYSTGKVIVQTNGDKQPSVEYNLYDIFKTNYEGRGLSSAEVDAKLDEIFKQNSAGQYVFKDYTAHTMKIFYMERGGGASNLRMRFNQSSVKPGTVILSKELSGVNNVEKFNAEFPYQIWYQDEENGPFKRLNNSNQHINVVYRSTNTSVKYKYEYTIDDQLYNDVFFLKPGESCEIKLPDETIKYYIVECGIDPYVYNHVYANEAELTGTLPDGAASGYDRRDYKTVDSSAKDRTSVNYVNNVNPASLRVLSFKKYLWNENGIGEGNELTTDDTTFDFRLYLATEHETSNELTLANMYTYHVKDPDGIYCRWDSTQQKFIPIPGANDYETMSDSDKLAASFTTSMNGTISKIPAFYTVEVRELLAGTKYRVEERYDEMPDGYSRIHYVVHDDVSETGHIEDDDTTSTIIKGKDPYVEVHNIKGFGIRIYKEWSDEQFVSYRDNTYFAVYKDSASGEVLDPDSIYMLKFSKSTLYWYYDRLDSGLTLQNYHIREVVIEDPVVNSEGKVTSYTSITPLADNGEFDLNARLKGENVTYPGTYKVTYDSNPDYTGNNMRVETIKNTRDGITINKTDNFGAPLAGARFEMRDDAGTLIGTFESDATGFVTMAYLRKGINYTLTEIKSPSGYAGLKNPLTIRMNADGSIKVTPDPKTARIDSDRFDYVAGPADPSITLINYRYDFSISKKDRLTNAPVAGVEFALHKQKTVGGVTIVDFQPIPGYEHLITRADGIVPGIDSTLAPGTYELREISTPSTHFGLNYFILFTVTETGDIRLNAVHPEVIVEEKVENDRVQYTLLIYNDPAVGDLMLSKQVEGNMGNRADEFPMTVTLTDGSGNPYVGTVYTQKNAEALVEHVLTAADNGKIDLVLGHGDSVVFFDIDDDAYFSITEDPKGYQSKGYRDGLFVSSNGTVNGSIKNNRRVQFINSRAVLLPTGVDSDIDVSAGIILAISAGFAITLILSRRRRREEC
ncbi:SpaA isopeptide-forming pilin-related protein [Butyrivibrio sp. AE2032]|uniref:SpaA isopeptide-forming pilin-related protein n=1 Tax=Butyrivibrio sp. AE2032 TaxID=1458463 RepID=UPI000551F8D1|nr:SpaA isopeptide-forming pilin-related protein [Butyrivibrio sp. AE2032]